MRQYELAQSETACLDLVKRLVGAKIANSVAVLRRFRRNHPEALASRDIDNIAHVLPGVEQARSLETLRGIEGTAAARYFPLLGPTLPPGFEFDGRSRRPPRDPINALLSFGYVLAGNEIQAILDAMGFDPYLGFFHQVDYGRPSLALDLLEEFRAPLVDAFSLGLLNLRILGPDDFRSTLEGGVLLRRESMKRYFPAYEKELTTPLSLDGEERTFRQLFRRQAERLAQALISGEPYQPFQLPC
jgi:CRISPR-associated protein Cas1